MSFTLAQVRTSIRYVLQDQSVWTDSQLNNWIKDAIRDYSSIFPRLQTFTITTTDGGRAYSLSDPSVFGSTIVTGIARVEYPAGETPPVFLERMPEASPNFYGSPVYDVRGDPPNQLVIGPSPTAGQSIYVTCTVVHEIPAGDAYVLTIPDQHINVIYAYVYWKALTFLEVYASIDPGRKASMIEALGKTSAQAEKYYYWLIERIRALSDRSGIAGAWNMDTKDRIY